MIDMNHIPLDVIAICRTLGNAGHEAFLVGGGVRDMLMGREPKDYDVATSALPDQVMNLFGSKFAIPTGLQHGTVTVLSLTKRHVEVTTFRSDGEYTDGRRPSSVEFGKTLQEDLSRRDFTMNAIAFDPITEKLEDPFGGLADIAGRRVRAVGDPVGRFVEDGLRVMRAVRQATQLGFTLDPATAAAVSHPLAMASFKKVSAERVRDELCKILMAPEPETGIIRLNHVGLLAVVLPELAAGIHLEQGPKHKFDVFFHSLATLKIAARSGVTMALRLAALLHEVGKPLTAEVVDGQPPFTDHAVVGAELTDQICRRLKLTNEDRELVVFLVANHEFDFEALEESGSAGDVRRFIRRMSKKRVRALLCLHDFDVEAWWGSSGTSALREMVEKHFGDACTTKELAVNGKDLMDAMSLAPGPKVGSLLEALLELVLEDASLNTRETLIERARSFP